MKFKIGDSVFFFEKREDVTDIEHEGVVESVGWHPDDNLYMIKIPNVETGGYTVVSRMENELMTIDELLAIPISDVQNKFSTIDTKWSDVND